MKNLLALTDKSEMAGFDDTRVNRSHSDLMKLFAIHMIERIVGYLRRFVKPVDRVADGFKPWVI
jgi:hypothetical protein